MPDVVKAQFARATTLSEKLAEMRHQGELLTREEKRLIVQQALILVEQNYAHLPLKRAMHAVDPVQRFKLLLQSLEPIETPEPSETPEPPQTPESELEFHNAVLDVFTSLRDLHTQYLLPEPWSELVAFLPFMVEEYFDETGARHFIASHVTPSFEHRTFESGVEIIHWNGTPIERAVNANAQRYAGSNQDARHARGVQSLTQRALRTGPPPEEDWVVVGYRAKSGLYAELRFDWVVNPTPEGATGKALTRPGSAAMLGIDLQQQIVQRARAALFAPNARTDHDKANQKLESGKGLGPLESRMPHVLQAKPVRTKSGTFGYVRIRTFNVAPEDLIDELARLVSALPTTGLILDVRGNGGGLIHSGEYLLQLFTPRRIEPEPVQFMNTRLNLQICQGHDESSPFTNLKPWTASMQQALQTGSAFSAGYPISDPDRCNAIGQRYFGPVVLITDALCYSTTDIFAAGFQDHEIGKVIGVDHTTGAGGANVWDHDALQFALAGEGEHSIYRPLPRGAGMRVSIRRTLRVGKLAGTPVEDLGVVSDIHHRLTLKDILEDNQDLKERAGEELKKSPARDLSVTARGAKGNARLSITVKEMDRVDVYVADRPVHSLAVKGRTVEVELDTPDAQDAVVEIRGFDEGTLVARFRVPWLEIAREVASAGTRKKGAAKRSPAKRGTAKRGPAKKAAFSARTSRSENDVQTPNLRDDSAAIAELSFAAFGGPALGSVDAFTAGALPVWRTARSLHGLIKQVNALAPGRNKAFDGTIGDAAHQTTNSDHNPWVKDGATGVVTACDITHDPQRGCDANRIAEAIRSSQDPRVKYVIWNRRIANFAPVHGAPAWAWREYKGANPHDKHVHISVKPDRSAYDSEMSWAL